MTVEAMDYRARSERLLPLCAVGLLACVLVIVLFLVVHVHLPEGVATVLLLIVLFPYILLPGLAVSLFVCLSAGVGLLAVANAKSRRGKWVAGLAHFMPLVGLVAWWLTLPDSWAQ